MHMATLIKQPSGKYTLKFGVRVFIGRNPSHVRYMRRAGLSRLIVQLKAAVHVV